MASTASLTSNPSTGSAFGPPNTLYKEYGIDVACDATSSAPPAVPIPANNPSAGVIGAVSVVLPATAYPNTLTIVITDQNGVTIFTSTVTGSASLKKRLFLTDGENDGRIDFVGPLTVTMTGNTTASATWKVFILVF